MGTLVALPVDLLADVLGRLPARSLAASQRVCKAWRDLIGDRRLLLRLRHLLPHTVRGLFINYMDYSKPHFLARPAPAADDGPRIDGKFDFVVRGEDPYWHHVADHCNGLVLFQTSNIDVFYVCNPTTRRWARLPPCSRRPWDRRAFLVFDPAASPQYKVLLAPREPKEKDADAAACRLMEWPPSPWTWDVFSSETGRWEEKVFLREGEAAGTVDGLLFIDSSAWYFRVEARWRYAAYWQGKLYIHCQGEYVSRLSLLNDKYQVIKSPIDLAEWNNNVRSFLGRSEKGVYFAAIDGMDKLRVWTLDESSDQIGWVSKHQSDLNTYLWSLRNQKGNAPWTLDIRYKTNYPEVQNVCWNSDDDDIIDDSYDEYKDYDRYVKFLGFHPYKEVIYLCSQGWIAVACHLNSSKVQYLGRIHLDSYNRGEHESFVYTPCLIGASEEDDMEWNSGCDDISETDDEEVSEEYDTEWNLDDDDISETEDEEVSEQNDLKWNSDADDIIIDIALLFA